MKICRSAFLIICCMFIVTGCGDGLSEIERLLDTEQYDLAVKALEDKVLDNSDCAKCLYLLGNARFALSKISAKENKRKLYQGAIQAYTGALKLDPSYIRAALHRAYLLVAGSNYSLESLQLTKQQYATMPPGVKARFNESGELVPVDYAVGQSLEWIPVLAKIKPNRITAIILYDSTDISGTESQHCGSLNRGEVLNIESIDEDRALFAHYYPVEGTGWMLSSAFDGRKYWGQGYHRAVNGPIVFLEEPKAWGFKGHLNQHDAHWKWLLNNHKHITLRMNVEWGSLEATGESFKVLHNNYRYRYWRPVKFTQMRYEQRSINLVDLALGTGDFHTDKVRVDRVIASWPEDVKLRLLKGEMTQGLTRSAVYVALGSNISTVDLHLGTEVVKETCLAKPSDVTIVFEDGILVSWSSSNSSAK